MIIHNNTIDLPSEDINEQYNLEFDISVIPDPQPGGLDYDKLHNKPLIEGVLLQGNSLLTDFGTNNIYLNSTEGWDSQRSLIGKQGAIYIYSDHNQLIKDGQTINVPGIKIGDGLAYLIDAPFIDNALSQNVVDMITSETISQLEQANRLVSVADRIRWNNKVSATMDSGLESENLILSNLI